jgi:DNA-binding MarR family transcriptional regulator
VAGEQAEGVPDLGHGPALGEMLSEDGRQGALGLAEGLAELTVHSGGAGHGGSVSLTVDRYLSMIQLRQEAVYMPAKRFPSRPMIGLLVRLIYQQYSQAMDAALHEAGFDDIGPSAGNVFPFVGPDGITVSELADLAHVRKQTMAQAVEQLERTDYVERRPNPKDRRSQLVFLTERGKSVPPVTHAAAERIEARWASLTGIKELENLRKILLRLLDESHGRSS